ncbi:MAG TPA: nitroreductase [Nitrospirota bacterium]|nr:nitroreductase [Nitrospirota bacterium]
MNVTVALKNRRTIRAFKPDRVDRDLLVKVLEPALRAPSWANTQPWEIFVAAGEPLERLRKAYGENLKNCVPRNPDIVMPREWPDACRTRMEALKAERTEAMEQACRPGERVSDLMQMNYKLFNAPVVVYLCMDRCLTPWSLFDLGAMSQSIMLSAEEQGLGSAVAVTLAAHPDLIRRELGIPDDLAVVIGIALGYPDPGSPQNKFRSSRRPLADVIKFSGF